MKKNWMLFLSMLAFSAVLYSCGEGGEMEGGETMEQQEMEIQGENEGMDQEMNGEEFEGME